jgi:hypothetical protein
VAYAQPDTSSDKRSKTLKPWLHIFNTTRNHDGIKYLTPFARGIIVLGYDS